MASDLWAEIEQLRQRWDVLDHPFYRRWTAGELSAADLRAYASEYHHAVVAVALASERAATAAEGPASADLADHALEERGHVELWIGFARAVGWNGRDAWHYAESPLVETVQCARVWSCRADEGLDRLLVTLYAIESAQPQISRVKLDGLRRHYGISDGEDTEYFRVHAQRDGEHAALARRALSGRLEPPLEPSLLAQADAAYRANWQLLDGVQRLTSR